MIAGTAAIVLAGGESTRMGRSKALLDWDGVPLIAHIAGVARESVRGGPVVVAAGRSQRLPLLPEGVEVVRDAERGEGPLRGLLAGLVALDGRAAAAFVIPVDIPLLRAELATTLVDLLEDEHDAVVPVVDGRRQPLVALYRVSLAPVVATLLDDGVARVSTLLESCRCRWVARAELLADPALAAADPELDSLVNVNTEAELAAARRRWIERATTR